MLCARSLRFPLRNARQIVHFPLLLFNPISDLSINLPHGVIRESSALRK